MILVAQGQLAQLNTQTHVLTTRNNSGRHECHFTRGGVDSPGASQGKSIKDFRRMHGRLGQSHLVDTRGLYGVAFL